MTGSTNQFIHFEPTNTLSKIHPKNYNNSPLISKSWIRACIPVANTINATYAQCIANFKNVSGLGRVSYIDYIENLNISTTMLLND